MESANKQVESKDDIVSKDFIDFLTGENYTADEVASAYYQFCGVMEDESSDERIVLLRTRMDEMSNEGYPINRFAKLIGLMQEYEYALPNFSEYVESLPVSDKEKMLLRSIVEKKRFGDLECHIDGEEIARIRIMKNDGRESSEGIALALLDRLKQFLSRVEQSKLKSGKVSFWFEEK